MFIFTPLIISIKIVSDGKTVNTECANDNAVCNNSDSGNCCVVGLVWVLVLLVLLVVLVVVSELVVVLARCKYRSSGDNVATNLTSEFDL